MPASREACAQPAEGPPLIKTRPSPRTRKQGHDALHQSPQTPEDAFDTRDNEAQYGNMDTGLYLKCLLFRGSLCFFSLHIQQRRATQVPLDRLVDADADGLSGSCWPFCSLAVGAM